jgi:hypothetical protein
LVAALAFVKLLGAAVEVFFEDVDFVWGGFGFEFARFTEAADEALGDNTNKGRVEKVGFDIEVEKSEESTDGVFSVESGEDELACETRFDGDFGGFLIADFTD